MKMKTDCLACCQVEELAQSPWIRDRAGLSEPDSQLRQGWELDPGWLATSGSFRREAQIMS